MLTTIHSYEVQAVEQQRAREIAQKALVDEVRRAQAEGEVPAPRRRTWVPRPAIIGRVLGWQPA